MTIACRTCLDSGLVANDRVPTPWPTVLADREMDFDRREGLIRPVKCPVAGCAAGREPAGWAEGYISGHAEALRAARAAIAMSAEQPPARPPALLRLSVSTWVNPATICAVERVPETDGRTRLAVRSTGGTLTFSGPSAFEALGALGLMPDPGDD